ncbi:MAG: ABC transporter ATP-binding protein [Ruminococcus sp.]|nr:ABC transporter ATP-binding protein [Ruminococcus sp.]
MSIEIKNLTKNFGNVTALDNVSLSFENNKIYGLLGRNGAGKSTLLNIITNRVFKTSGEILIDNEKHEENDNAISKIYLMSEKTLYPRDMKIKDIFKWSKRFYPDFDTERAYELSKMFELNTNKKVKALSTGFTSIFKLIIALCVNTPYVFLDEPVLGLDANNRELFYKLLIEKYSEKPFTVIISTHLIEEISSFIENAIIIDSGKVIVNTTREELLQSGYSVSGKICDVNNYISDKEIIGEDTFGGLKTAYVMGKPDTDISENLEVTSMDLQKLFVKLTNTKEVK